MAEVLTVTMHEVNFHLATLARDLTQGLDEVAQWGGKQLQEVLVAREPEVSGAMKASTVVQPAGPLHYPVIIGVPYAQIVNDVTAKSVPTHFVESAVDAVGPELLARLDAHFIGKGGFRR